MLQIAIFVDAGYLFAQGSALLKGQKQPRSSIELIVAEVLTDFSAAAREAAPTARLLRIYWYDGILRGGRLTPEQSEIANSPSTKLRLGMVNSKGEQKGVDSLIVTDLIDLARNRAISDALIMSGDEDIRVGVQVAQTFGVRIHILGVKPARGSQSPDLLQEADSSSEWDDATVKKWLRVKTPHPFEATGVSAERQHSRDQLSPTNEFSAVVKEECLAAIRRFDGPNLDRLRLDLVHGQTSIPPELDRPTLAALRMRLNRDLTDGERKEYRKAFGELLKSRQGR